MMAKYQDQIDIINKYFKQRPATSEPDYSQYKSQEYRPE